jgi:hypothetical protein
VVLTKDEEKSHILPKNNRMMNEVNISNVIQILKQSLEQKYNINNRKFDVDKLINKHGRVRSDLLEKLMNKINAQLHEAHKNIDIHQVFLDFGSYPMPQNWQVKVQKQPEETNDRKPASQIEDA